MKANWGVRVLHARVFSLPQGVYREAIQRMNKDMRDRIVIANRTAARDALKYTYVDLLTGEPIMCTAVNSSVRGDPSTDVVRHFKPR